MIIIQIIALTLLIYIIYILAYIMLRGAPYAALSRNRIETMMKLLAIKKGGKFVDLGSGDGRIVIAASKEGAAAFGYEINPILYIVSLIKLKKSNIHAKIFFKDFWGEDLSQYKYIAVWGVSSMMKRLEKKIRKEAKPGTLIVSNHFQLPTMHLIKQENEIYLYKIE